MSTFGVPVAFLTFSTFSASSSTMSLIFPKSLSARDAAIKLVRSVVPWSRRWSALMRKDLVARVNP